jgi:O-antigen ligase/tetratricopeptide (TPR) repeat protein
MTSMRNHSQDDRGLSSTAAFAGWMSDLLRYVSVLCQMITLAVVPWLLGGAIPQARLLLQMGAMTSSAFALLSIVFRRRLPDRFPLTAIPLLGLCGIGILQLAPVHQPTALQMAHAVHPDLARDLPAFAGRSQGEVKVRRTVLPADTRLAVGQFLAIAAFVITVHETATTQRVRALLLTSLVVSGCGMTGLALSQQFGTASAVIGNHWKVSDTVPFGCFVNPNNAAGWLIVCVTAALVLTGMSFRRDRSLGIRPGQRESAVQEKLWRLWTDGVSRLAALTPTQIVLVSSAAFLLAGVAATLSRAGIMAALLGLAALTLSRFRIAEWFFASLGAVVLMLAAAAFLVLIELDTLVLSELRTLKDPVSDATGRVLHWSDSLTSVLDFPVLGTGMGAYRFSTLPYQRHYSGRWFQRADNQYVEVLVESGVLGFLCCGALIVVGLMMTRRLLIQDSHGSALISDGRWLASGVLGILVALSSAAFFDYGVSLPSIALSAATLMVMLEQVWNSLNRREESSDVRRRPGLAGRLLNLTGWIAVAAATVLYIPDTLAACRVYDAQVPAERQLAKANVHQMFENGVTVRAALAAALQSRPDDFAGRRILALFEKHLGRTDLVARAERELPGQHSEARRENLFRQLMIGTLANELLKQKTSPEARAAGVEVLRAMLEKYPWDAAAHDLMQDCSFAPGISADLFLLETTGVRDADDRHSLASLRFAEPHSASQLYRVGLALLHAGRIGEATECWRDALNASDMFTGEILVAAASEMGHEQALHTFLPTTFEGCAKALNGVRSDSQLHTAVSAAADEYWEEKESAASISPSTALLRANQLEATNRLDEAVEWLTVILGEHPTNIPLRRLKAILLEKQGNTVESYNEWLTLLEFDPVNSEAEAALKRLIRLPPPVKSKSE